MIKPIAILGCGPAGLMAAHACALSGKPFVILSQPVKSNLGGAQFLHMAIPELTPSEPDGVVQYKVQGNPGYYQTKVYGANPHVPFVSMSFVKDGDKQPAWSLQRAYEYLWARFGEFVSPVYVNSVWLKETMDEFSLVISSIPLEKLCLPWANHKFISARCQIYNKHLNCPEDTIMYDGTEDHAWYRQSNIFGTGSTEYPSRVTPIVSPVVWANKPVWTNCDCWPNIIKIGRHGRWEKGVLSHDGFTRTMEALSEMH